MERPPNIKELVGQEPPSLGLDERCVAEHFLGNTQADALREYARRGILLTEDFAYMADGGLRYYLSPVLEYLQSDESLGESEFCLGLLTSLASQVRFRGRLSAEALKLIREVAAHVDGNRAKFGIEGGDEWANELLAVIRGSN